MGDRMDLITLKDISEWFKLMHDGSWGAGTLFQLMGSMGISSNKQADLRGPLNDLLMSSSNRTVLHLKYGIDVKFAEVDGSVVQVRFRQAGTQPKGSMIKPKARDARLPAVGTILGAVISYEGEEYFCTATELENGSFACHVKSTFVGMASSLSQAARVVSHDVTGDWIPGINGYLFFKLGKKPPKEISPVEIAPRNFDDVGDIDDFFARESKATVCPCGKGIDAEGDGYALYTHNTAPVVTDKQTKQAFINEEAHRTRPSVIWGAQAYNIKGDWFAAACGLVAPGKTPEEAMANWDLLFTTGK